MADENVLVDVSVKERVLRHIKSSAGDVVGYLYGAVSGKTAQIIGCAACKNSTPSKATGCPNVPGWIAEHDELCSFFPTGISLCGIYYSSAKPVSLAGQNLQNVFDGLDNEDGKNNSYVVWQLDAGGGSDESCYFYNRHQGNVAACNITASNIKSAFMDERIALRIKATFPLSISYQEQEGTVITQKLQKLCDDVHSLSTAFYIKDCNMLLRNGTDDKLVSSTCEDLLSRMAMRDDNLFLSSTKSRGKKPKGKEIGCKYVKSKDVIDVRCLKQLTRNKSSNAQEDLVRVVLYEKVSFKERCFNILVDVLVIAKVDTPLRRLEELIAEAVCSQLRQMSRSIQKHSKDGNLWIPKPYHFKLPGFCHLLTTVYPHVSIQSDLVEYSQFEPYRRELLAQFLLSPNKPLLKPCNAHVFDSEKTEEIYLRNPHEGIASSGIADGILAVVDGVYSYHHYMQDNFNDDGWGCAYRSLQTICSWFRHQGYTSKPVPSHREIQQALVDIGDKNSNFVGSKQWIGSFEVSMCLEHLIDVTSKIMYVNSGAEMATKDRELLHHFQTQGTPIMIGGGVLAHTILGVDFDDRTGDIRFLILDPHYTGNEDLKIILDKGWCGWKGPNFWNQQAHYNMCLPQRRDMV